MLQFGQGPALSTLLLAPLQFRKLLSGNSIDLTHGRFDSLLVVEGCI